jgi:3-hydroxyisobutyrate dehydrogenase-like beta-hydroxyacid dehydrogenase
MLNIFKKIKNIIMKKEELEQQLAEAIAVAQRLGIENKQLKQTNDDLTASNARLTEDFNGAIERVRYLAEQLKMKESQQTATDRFNDNDRNY